MSKRDPEIALQQIYDILWAIVVHDLPGLVAKLEKILDR